MATTEPDFTQRTRQLEERIVDPRSIISIDSLLDSINALVYDSECVKKTKNFDTFYAKCWLTQFFVFINLIFFYSSINFTRYSR